MAVRLPERLTTLRKEHDKTQDEMARFLGITRPAYTAYETGRRQPDYETLIKLADFFNVPIDWILGRTNNRKMLDSDVHLETDEIVNDSQIAADIGSQLGKEASPELLKLIREVVNETLEEKRHKKDGK